MNITFRYPPMWYVLEEGSSQFPNLKIQNYDPATAPGRGYDSLEDKGEYLMTVNRAPVGYGAYNIDQLITKLPKEGDETYYIGEPAGKIKIVKIERGEINGFPKLLRTISFSKLVNVFKDEIYLLDKKGNAFYVLFGLDVSGGKKILNQILSTFKFLD